MERELKFSTEVLTKAEYQPNVIEFYSRAFLESDTADNFRVLPGIKTSERIGSVVFGNLLKPAGCSWAAASQTLGAIDIDVTTLDCMIEFCQYDLEQSFVAEKMSKGAGAGTWQVPEFMSFVWGEAAKETNEEIELIRWQGDKAGTFDEDEAFLEYVDGYIVKLVAAETGVTATANGTGTAATFKVNVGKRGTIVSVDVLTAGAYSVAPTTLTLANVGEGKGATFTVQTTGSSPSITVTGVTVVTAGAGYAQRVNVVSGTTLSSTNILAEMGKVYAAIPRAIRRRKDLIRWHMDPVAADFYRLATAAGNTFNYIVKALDLTYLDMKIVVNDGMPVNNMVLTRKDNLIYAFDATTDGKSLELVDMSKTTAEPTLRARTAMRMGFHLTNEAEIVFYRP